MSRLRSISQLDTSDPEKLKRDLARLVNELDGMLNVLERAPRILTGVGSPEGAVAAPIGTLFTSTLGGANTTLYVKESGAGKTGWVAK